MNPGSTKLKAALMGGAACALIAAALALVSSDALAQAAGAGYVEHLSAGTGQPIQGQMTLQNPVTEVASDINWLHGIVNKIIIAIAAFVLILLAIVVFRFNEKKNPTPSRTTHHAGLEVAWTVLPILVLVVIAIPSFRLLYKQYSFPKPDITIKAIGNAWFWEHEYLDEKIKVTSNMITDEDVVKAKFGDAQFKTRYNGMGELQKIKAMQEDARPVWGGTEKIPAVFGDARLVRQLSVNNEIAVPVGKVVHMLITSNDVIHSWTIPSFGSKMQAVPGRITATWFKAEKIGIYYGQCSVLCGKEHSSMPIAVRVVSDKAYADWLVAVKARDMRRARGILQAATADVEKKSYAAAN